MWRGRIDFPLKHGLPALALLGASTVGYAGSAVPTAHDIAQRYSRPFLICAEAHPNEGEGFEVCEAQVLPRQKAALTEAYMKAVARLSQQSQASLAGSQRQWLIDSGNACHAKCADKAADESYDGCMIDETIRRTLWLEKLG